MIVGHWIAMYLFEIPFALHTAKMTINVNWVNLTEMTQL